MHPLQTHLHLFSDPYAYSGPYKGQFPHGYGTHQQNDEIYTGALQQGLRHGYGQLAAPAYTYQGAFRANAPIGEGKLLTADAEIRANFDRDFTAADAVLRFRSGENFIGDTTGGRVGKSGKYQGFGEFYDGDFACGQFCGRGTLICDQFSYEGDFLNGLRHGSGKLNCNSKNLTYVGSFRNDQKCGFGVEKCPEFEFRGEFRSGQMLSGTVMYQDGSTYEGAFLDGLRCGPGVIRTSQNVRLEGEFQKDEIISGEVTCAQYSYRGALRDFQMNGQGVYKRNSEIFTGSFKNDEIVSGTYRNTKENTFYTGQFRNFRFSGKGVLQTLKGTLTGTFSDNKAQGFCKFSSQDQKIRFQGHYRGGKRNGEGFLEQPGYSYTGQWKDDFQNGYGVETKTGGNVFQGQFEHGDRVYGVGKKEVIDISPDRIFSQESRPQKASFRKMSSSRDVSNLSVNTNCNSIFHSVNNLSQCSRFRSKVQPSNLALMPQQSVCPGISEVKQTAKRWRRQ
ncbi:putative Phosphatidylinositol-4-phosphate 5-kinase [Spironucleus salmonicida]|uniref:Phosphatidylinositol-4-phosphate 5-kinase n=1 Tax=Spironucleus salmonicida TaxID=348837 RepID=V6LYK9_9EUKA|nr:putative Phosphatidylinositol-4-phosphate 5-kinase [Spironucleus salmonicida]|eukprot:EST48806.1 hypothetical protein SS50377_10901 [Spironucleus salmonicida]